MCLSAYLVVNPFTQSLKIKQITRGLSWAKLSLGLNKFDLNNGNGGFGEGLNMSFEPTDKVGWVDGWVAGLDWNKTNSASNLDLDSGLSLAILSNFNFNFKHQLQTSSSNFNFKLQFQTSTSNFNLILHLQT